MNRAIFAPSATSDPQVLLSSHRESLANHSPTSTGILFVLVCRFVMWVDMYLHGQCAMAGGCCDVALS